MEQARSGAGSSKLAKCRHFNPLSFVHSTVTSQGTDGNIDIGFCENQNDIESSNEISEDSRTTTNSHSTISISNAIDTCQAKNKSKRKSENIIDVQLRESLNNVNDAVKTNSDLLFCRSLADSLRGLTPGKNKISRMKIQKVLFEVEFEDNTDV